MADLLIRVHDKPSSGDAEIDARRLSVGDVVVVRETPWPWAREELANRDWRILRLPNITRADAFELTRPEIKTVLDADRVMRARRARLNIESPALPAALKTWLADDTRARPIFTSNISRASFLLLVRAKVARQALRVL